MSDNAESQLAVEEALYARLQAATASGQPLVGVNVADNLTQLASYPAVVIGEMFPEDYSDKSNSGMQITCQIHVWWQTHSSKVGKQIQQALYGLLHNQVLSLTNSAALQNNYLLRFQSAIGLQIEDDQITRHAVLKYRILTRAAN